MERTVPKTGGEEIQLYMRTYYSLLRSSDAIQIETLIESHIAMESSLHVGASELEPDVSAWIYGALRLPACIAQVDEVLIGQIEKSFRAAGYGAVETWERVFAPGRRRRMHFDGESRLLVYIASRSDIDDLVPILTAYQHEWNKLHLLLRDTSTQDFLKANLGRETALSDEECTTLSERIRVGAKDLRRLELVWSGKFFDTLWLIAKKRKQMGVRLISGSMADYRRATASWWDELMMEVSNAGIDPEQSPVYFVSSNTHALVNLLTGYATRYEERLVEFVKRHNNQTLLTEYEDIQASQHKNLENWLYYTLGQYLSEHGSDVREELRRDEREIGIYRVPNKHGFEIEAQIIALSRLRPAWLDSRLLNETDLGPLSNSDALIINIDYPLGMAAYEILSRITERVARLQGIYVMGKAATLNGRIGDVMIPNVIHDEHSQNTYLFDNVFSARNVNPYMTQGSVLDNQKSVTALGTFLQNPGYMSVFYREGYTDIEMEGGPYLSAVYEAFRPKRHPIDEVVNMYGVPFDVGFLHYASDTPMKKGHNLGSGNLNYMGIEATYATAVAIIQRILGQEMRRLESQASPLVR